MTIEKDNFISENIRKIKTGNKDEIKTAKKAIDKLWNTELGKKGEDKNLLFRKFKNELVDFDSIKNINNKIAFIRISSVIWLGYVVENYELLSDFLLIIIQHKNGNLRRAAVSSFEYLLMDILGLFVLKEYNKKKHERLMLNYCRSIDIVHKLIEKNMSPKYYSYKYISELPTSIYKSLQQLLNVLLNPIPLKAIYEKYRQEKETKNINENYNFDEKDKWDLYYDAMEDINNDLTEAAKLLLNKALKIDQDFVAAEVGLIETYKVENNLKQRVKHIELAYKKTLKHFPVLPEILEWGEIENRQYFRAIYNKAVYAQEIKNLKEAEKFYKLILEFDPDDHMGIRYYLAGMFAGIMPDGIDELFDKGNQLQDWSEVENLFIKQNKKHNFFKFIEDEEEWSEE